MYVRNVKNLNIFGLGCEKVNIPSFICTYGSKTLAVKECCVLNCF